MKLNQFCSEAYIIAHTENVSSLSEHLSRDGFAVSEVRGPYNDVQLKYPSSMRCLINHANAWQEIARRDRNAIVVEADFVPVRGFGTAELPMPFALDDSAQFAYLYSCGTTLYGIDAHGFAFGHGNTTVAYALSPVAASALLQFCAREIESNLNGGYSSFETRLGVFLRRERGMRNYFSNRVLGEHGGVANLEHRKSGVRAWHEADILAGRLAFLPQYARGSQIAYRLRRLRGYFRGVARLLLLRFYDPRYIDRPPATSRLRMALFSIGRLLPRWPWTQRR